MSAKGGRKSKADYWLTKEGMTLLKGWAIDGLTDKELCQKMGISLSTLYDWKLKFSEFSESIKKGKEVADNEVEQSLFKRAVGYEYNEETFEPDSEGTMRMTKQVKKQVVPDTTAQIYWLGNRRPDKWRNKQEHKIEGEINGFKHIEELLSEMKK